MNRNSYPLAGRLLCGYRPGDMSMRPPRRRAEFRPNRLDMIAALAPTDHQRAEWIEALFASRSAALPPSTPFCVSTPSGRGLDRFEEGWGLPSIEIVHYRIDGPEPVPPDGWPDPSLLDWFVGPTGRHIRKGDKLVEVDPLSLAEGLRRARAL